MFVLVVGLSFVCLKVSGDTTCVDSSNLPLYSIKFDFTKARPMVGTETMVRCSLQDKDKSCFCEIGETTFLPHLVEFIMVPDSANRDRFGVLEVRGTEPRIQISCGDRSGARTPSVAMIEDLMQGANGIVNCSYKERARFSDESQGSKPIQGSHEKKDLDGSLNLQQNEQRLIVEALQRSNGDATVAAKKLGISQRALLRKMKESKTETNAQ